MRWLARLFLLLCTTAPATAAPQDEPVAAPKDRLRVLVWNIQRGARHFDDGPEKALAVIRSVAPDLCLLQESYALGEDRPTLGHWLAEALGWNAWQGESPHLCVLTPLEIREQWLHHPWHGLGARVADARGREFLTYSIWIDYRAYLPYALRDEPELSDEKLLACESEGSGRVAQTTALLAHLEGSGALAADVPLLVGGDWNCPSHLDWTDDTARLFRHRRSLPLPVSRLVADAGLIDTFRVVHPDPTRVPGITWSPLARGTVEAPEPADRIDRLYLRAPTRGPRLRPVGAFTLPRVLEPAEVPQAERAFPSDHGAVVLDFEWVDG